jgi:hypothetical protein
MKTNNTLVGILSGMAAELLGILFAPDKGRN